MTNTMFGREIAKRFEKGRSRAGYTYVGIGLGYRYPHTEHDQPDETAEGVGCVGYVGFPTTFSDQREEENKENNKKFVDNPTYPTHPTPPSEETFLENMQAAPDFTCDDNDITPPEDDGYSYDDDDIPSDNWYSEDTWGSSPP